MYRVFSCLTTEHDLRLVGLAAVVCFLASFAAINLLHRARTAGGRTSAFWVGTAGIATGFGIWATHFIAMLAYEPGVGVAYAVGLTVLSLIAATTVTAAGLALAVIGPKHWAPPIGGAVVGAGVACMHFVGMAAVELPGQFDWALDLVLISVAFSMLLGVAALAVAAGSDDFRATIAATLLLTLAIVSHHFTAMAAVTVVPDPARAIEGFSLDPGSLAVAIAAAAVSVIGICLIAAFVDRRSKAILHQQNVRLDRAISNMAQGLSMFDATGRLLVCNEKYSEIYRLPAGALRPGDTFREVVMRRAAHGMLAEDPEKYCARVLPILLNAKSAHRVVEQVAGRSIAIASQPMPAGGWVATHEDITERLKAAQDHERTRKFLDTIVENMPATLIVKKVSDLQYVLINRAGEEALGVSRSELIGKTAYDYFSTDDAKAITARDRRVIQTGEIIAAEYSGHTRPGGRRQLSARVAAIAGEDGRPEYVMTLVEDVTERKRAEARVAHLALHSPLTDLPNRTAFNERLIQLLERATATGNGLAVLCVDLDRFKEINDVFGHSVGDVCLRLVSERLRRAAQGAFLAHLGGDEFALIVADGPQPVSTELLGDRLLEVIKEEVDVGGQRIGAALSIGVAIYPADGDDAETLLCNADAALERAKAEGRGSMRFFEAAMDTRLRERRALQQDLRNALDRGEISLHYQPQARIDGETTGFEALVRWQHPSRGTISPGQFIPVAEECGLIGPIGEWILREACREAASWPKPLHVAVNFSPVQFRLCNLPDLVHRVLLETGLAAHRLEVEITESVLIGDFNGALAILRRLKALGVKIAMDDFGTGYSSLSYLQSFPFDKIKIDRAFTSNVDSNPQSAAIVRAVLGLGRSLGLPVVAEGVETKEQLSFLARERCEQVQGYLIGRPSLIAVYARLVGRETVPARHQAAG